MHMYVLHILNPNSYSPLKCTTAPIPRRRDFHTGHVILNLEMRTAEYEYEFVMHTNLSCLRLLPEVSGMWQGKQEWCR
jgi:hypothetical protein